MNRRNVLGNKIEESKTMWVVLLGLLVTALQFTIYHKIEDAWLEILLSGLCIFVGSILVHVITGEQNELFSYLLIPCVISGSVGLLIPQLNSELLPESSVVLMGCLLSWLLPVLYACLFSWAEGNVVMDDFVGFYKKAVLFFYVIYFGTLIYGVAFQYRVTAAEVDVQLIPFATFAAYVDGMIKGSVSSGQMMEFIVSRVLLFLPYGFFIAMVGRRIHGFLRLVLLVLLPGVIELLQLLFKWNTCDMDDIVFPFLGGLLGMVCFFIFNALFQKFTGKNFDGSEVERDYYGRKL